MWPDGLCRRDSLAVWRAAVRRVACRSAACVTSPVYCLASQWRVACGVWLITACQGVQVVWRVTWIQLEACSVTVWRVTVVLRVARH